jgi:hypothetical protein
MTDLSGYARDGSENMLARSRVWLPVQADAEIFATLCASR